MKKLFKKRRITKLILSILLLTHFAANGDEIEITEAEIASIQNQPQPEVAKAPSFYEYNNRMVVFSLSTIAYERTKINALYVGVDYWEKLASIAGNYNSDYPPLGKVHEAELRIGYNFFYNGNDHLTPIIGGGIFYDSNKAVRTVENGGTLVTVSTADEKKYAHRYKEFYLSPITYGTFGFLYDHEFNSVFNLGFNAKGIFGQPIKDKYWGNPVVGCDVSLPITFRFGHQRHWDLRIEPFDVYLKGPQLSRNYFGFYNTIGYRF